MKYVVMKYDMDCGAYVDVKEFELSEYREANEFGFMLHVTENAMTILRMKKD